PLRIWQGARESETETTCSLLCTPQRIWLRGNKSKFEESSPQKSGLPQMLASYPSNDDNLQRPGRSFLADGLNGAPGVKGFQVLEDPTQPRVRALQIETAGGGTFTLAVDAKVAMALATALISLALKIDPALKEQFVERVTKLRGVSW